MHTTHTKHRATDLFHVLLRTIQRFNYGKQESKKQFAAYDSNTPVTSKQGQGHQTWYEFVNKQGYNNAKFEKPHLKLEQSP